MIRMLLEDPPVPIRQRRPDVPAGLADVLQKCLARDPADRYPTAGAMRRAPAVLLILYPRDPGRDACPIDAASTSPLSTT